VDFQFVTNTLLKAFEERDIDYAVIGGFALGFWGVTRATVDIDIKNISRFSIDLTC
jgi:hypothetical protein